MTFGKIIFSKSYKKKIYCFVKDKNLSVKM